MQVKEHKPVDVQAGSPITTPEPRRVGWVRALVAVLTVAVLALGAALVYPAVTTTDGEAVMNEMIDAWNSGDVTTFPDVYAPDATMVVGDTVAAKGLAEIQQSAGEIQAVGFQVERTGSVTESDNLIAYPATVTTDTETADAMIVLRYENGMILEHVVVWQTP